MCIDIYARMNVLNLLENLGRASGKDNCSVSLMCGIMSKGHFQRATVSKRALLSGSWPKFDSVDFTRKVLQLPYFLSDFDKLFTKM